VQLLLQLCSQQSCSTMKSTVKPSHNKFRWGRVFFCVWKVSIVSLLQKFSFDVYKDIQLKKSVLPHHVSKPKPTHHLRKIPCKHFSFYTNINIESCLHHDRSAIESAYNHRIAAQSNFLSMFCVHKSFEKIDKRRHTTLDMSQILEL